MIKDLLKDKYIDISDPKKGIKTSWIDSKKTNEYKGEIVHDGELKQVTFFDAELMFTGVLYNLDIIGLFEDETGFEFRKKCKAPEGCEIDWSTLLCSFDLITNK